MLLEALLPIVLITGLGFVLARSSFTQESGWHTLERLTYYLFFPALLIERLASAEVSAGEFGRIALVLGLALAILSALFSVVHRVVSPYGAASSSVYQGSIRFNTYIGLAVIEALFGESGLRQAALCLLVYIPAVNILSVIALSLHSASDTGRVRQMLASVFTNPLVLACAAGLLLSEASFTLPDFAESLLLILSQPALPLGLLAVGAGIRFTSLSLQSKQMLAAITAKLLLFPLLVLFVSLMLGLDGQLARVLLLLSALPAPPSAFILARQLGGDAALMANIISVQSLLVVFTLPAWIEIAARTFC